MSEAEIIKVALAEKYSKEVTIPLVDKETEKLIAKGVEDYENGRYTDLDTDEDIDKNLGNL